MSKQAGRMSQGANDFLAPYAPTIGTATDVGTGRAYNNGAATVTFTATGPNAADSFTAYAVEDPTKTATGVSSPLTVTGLTSGTNYTFKVYGTNTAGGQGSDSSASNQITATTVPAAPTVGLPTDTPSGRAYNNGLVSLAFTAGATGGKAISGYTVLSSGSQTATGSTSPIQVSGLASATAYTFQVKATNANGDSAYSSASSSVTVTTAPAAPAAPSVSSAAVGGSAAQGSANTANDTVSWTAPANGGSAITNYYWASSDGKSGNTTNTSVVVSQESGTAQTYTVRADNANGNATSPASASITSAFSFTPFSVFGFSPFGVFGFSPFGVFGFSPFGVFGFSPFGFSPFSFGNTKGSLLGTTLVKTTNGLVEASSLSVGDELVSVVLPNLPESGWTKEEVQAWSIPATDLAYDGSSLTTTTIQSINIYQAENIVNINGDVFSSRHGILVNREGTAKFVNSVDVLISDLIWSTAQEQWVEVNAVDILAAPHDVISINCEPYDVFFTENMLVHDTNLDTPTV